MILSYTLYFCFHTNSLVEKVHKLLNNYNLGAFRGSNNVNVLQYELNIFPFAEVY